MSAQPVVAFETIPRVDQALEEAASASVRLQAAIGKLRDVEDAVEAAEDLESARRLIERATGRLSRSAPIERCRLSHCHRRLSQDHWHVGEIVTFRDPNREEGK